MYGSFNLGANSLFSMIATSKSSRFINLLPLVLLALAVLAYALYFSFLTITRYAAFESRALDMGNLVQAIWNTSRGNWFHLTNQPGIVNRLSLHVEPILLPIAALYRLNSRPEMLLVLQATIVALGALPAYALAQLKLKNSWIALLFAVAFLLHPSMQAANWLEFHPVTLAPTFLLAAFYFLFAGRTGWFVTFAVLAASCKEEIPLLVFMIGLYAWLALGRRRLGIATMVLSLAWALIAVFAIQDAFGGGNIHWGRYGYLGESPVEMVRALITQPGLVFAQLQRAQAVRYIVLLALPVAFSSFLAPEVYFLALPSFGINLLADFSPMHQVDGLIYAAPVVPFVIVSGIVGVERLGRWIERSDQLRASAADSRHWLPVAGVAITSCLFVSQWFFGYLPGGSNYQLFTVTEHHRRAAGMLEQIPPDAKVSVQDKLNPHVANRETLHIFPRIDDADTVLVDVTGPAWPQHPNDVRTTVDELLSTGFGVLAAEDGFLLLSRNAETQRIPDAFYDSWVVEPGDVVEPVDDASEAGRSIASFDGLIDLVDVQVGTDQHGELVTETIWRALKPIPDDLRFYIGYLDSAGSAMADTLFYPPVASLWYPTSLWAPGELVRVNTLPRTLDSEQFTLVVGLYPDEGDWQNGERLSIQSIDPDVILLEGETLVRLGGYELSGRDWQPVAPSAGQVTPISARFGETILLDGVSLEERSVTPGDAITFALMWRADDAIAFDYSIFAHLLNSENEKVAQLDWQPNDGIGPRSMTTWSAGEILVDEQSLTLSEGLPNGDYRLVIGVYDWRDGQRLKASGDNVEAGNLVTIAQISVE